MPYSTNPNTTVYNPSQPLPQHLEHKPIYAFPYEHFDGIYVGNTDAKYISVGIAQYDSNHVSIKTMRYNGQWSRQAEELPLHRVIDMSLFLAKVIFDTTNGGVSLSKRTFLNQTSSDINVRQEQCGSDEIATYNAFLNQNRQLLQDRLNALRDVLNDLKNQGKI